MILRKPLGFEDDDDDVENDFLGGMSMTELSTPIL